MAQVQQTTNKPPAASVEPPRLNWRRARLFFMRALALSILGYGILSWAYVIGATDLGSTPFMDQRVPVKNAIAVFAAIDLVASVGLWMATAWGVVLWCVNTAIRVTLHTAYSDLHGGNTVLTAIEVGAVVVYVVLAFLAWREERLEDHLSRQRRRQTMNTLG
ncbi:DUF6163 family protein [Prosthecomicrobium hirschii]|uniref:Uncharacterized protein n=1 Tax=Prosthecodimorpha hirschii TaxID=665126 RepID=A0A0P6VUL5_9HYPH|nr:DUF6163 family protein [Prosthecomicrobium hirschii]KPL54941.1 hypothetical protein ABB55_24185 [Prosthecomicrobium hirschii]MCW1840149.1 DUF6163 family protein [Prosthecomicrobium hirschii]TPQ49650.1 hypothetical protein C2U72_17480 [Prosthecomicrobium hirschii]